MIEITFFDKRTPITYKNDSALDYDIIKFVSGMYTQINTIKLPAKEEGEEGTLAYSIRFDIISKERVQEFARDELAEIRMTECRIVTEKQDVPYILYTPRKNFLNPWYKGKREVSDYTPPEIPRTAL